MDVVDLRNFYAQQLGVVARRFVGHGIRARWPDAHGLRVVGIGYATPYLGLFRGQAERCLALGVPAIVSIHSINFHSTIRDFRSRTLPLLDEFLTTLESRHEDLLYVCDEDLYNLVEHGKFESAQGEVKVPVTKKLFGADLVLGRGA